MAQAINYTATGSGLSGWIAQIRKAAADYSLYRRTVDELQSLSDRDLWDLGISRIAIRQVAYESVYGG